VTELTAEVRSYALLADGATVNIRGAGYAGVLYAVNPHLAGIEGIPCAGSLAALPEPPDLEAMGEWAAATRAFKPVLRR
jgi:acyl-CoA synthetase (NDP forming)